MKNRWKWIFAFILSGLVLFCVSCSNSEAKLADYRLVLVEGDEPVEIARFVTDYTKQCMGFKLKSSSKEEGNSIYLIRGSETAKQFGYTLDQMALGDFLIVREGKALYLLASSDQGIDRGWGYLIHNLVDEDGVIRLSEGETCAGYGVGQRKDLYVGDKSISDYRIYWGEQEAEAVCRELQYYILQTSGDFLSIADEREREGAAILLQIDEELPAGVSGISIQEGDIVITGADEESLLKETYLFVNTYMGWMYAGKEGERVSAVSDTIHVPWHIEEKEAWMKEREATVTLWNTNYTRGVYLNSSTSLKNNLLDYTEEQLYEYVKMLKYCGYTGIQATEMCSAWAGADSYQAVHETIRLLADAAHSLDMNFTLWVWGASFEGFGWVDSTVTYKQGDSGFTYDNPAAVACFDKYYSIYSELADCCDRVIAHFYDPGELKTSEDVAYFSRMLRDKFMAVNPDIDFGVSCWVDTYDKRVLMDALGNDITLYEGTATLEEQKYAIFRRDVAALGTRMGTWAWNTCEMEIDQMAQMNFNMDIIRQTYQVARKYDEVYKPSYWSEMDSYHILNAFSLYCAGQMLIDPDIDEQELYSRLATSVVGDRYAKEFEEMLSLIQDARSGHSWDQYWWSNEGYILKSDAYPAEDILSRCERYIPVLEEMIDNGVESHTFPFPIRLEAVFRMMLPQLEQIRSFAKFRLELNELEEAYEQGTSKREIVETLERIAEPIEDYNSVIGLWGQVEARAQRELVINFCSRAEVEVPIYPEWDRKRKQYIYAQMVTEQKGAKEPVYVSFPYYQYGLAYGEETERLVEEMVQEGLLLRDEDRGVCLVDWKNYAYSFD